MEETNSTVIASASVQPVAPVVKSRSSFKIPLLAVFVVLMIGLSSLVTYLILKSPAPIVQVSPTPLPAEASAKAGDPTADWKTYTNTKYGFSFKYPEWVILEDKSVQDIAQVILVAQGVRETKVSATKNDLSLNYLDTVPSGKVMVGNLSGNKYSLPEGYCDGPSCSSPILAAGVINNSTRYIFSVFVEKNNNNFTSLENQILSTFRFAGSL